MNGFESHVSDRELTMAVDGELSVCDRERVERHLSACWTCRTRQRELETAIGDFVQMRQAEFDGQIPPPDGRRALLKAHLRQLVVSRDASWLRWLSPHWSRAVAWRLPAALMAVVCAVIAAAYFTSGDGAGNRSVSVTVPNPSLTPGAIMFLSREQVCREAGFGNKWVSLTVQRRVFDEYGLRTAQPDEYEVDYLITPALGGTDDIHNLWPQSKSGTIWNSEAKDGLEDHLRDLVCNGQLDLATAQHEIATNWIGAYKKYFQTEQPLNHFR